MQNADDSLNGISSLIPGSNDSTYSTYITLQHNQQEKSITQEVLQKQNTEQDTQHKKQLWTATTEEVTRMIQKLSNQKALKKRFPVSQ